MKNLKTFEQFGIVQEKIKDKIEYIIIEIVNDNVPKAQLDIYYKFLQQEPKWNDSFAVKNMVGVVNKKATLIKALQQDIFDKKTIKTMYDIIENENTKQPKKYQF